MMADDRDERWGVLLQQLHLAVEGWQGVGGQESETVHRGPEDKAG